MDVSKKALLIADDDEMNRRIIRKFLKDNFEVYEAENGKKALEIMGSVKVDVLLLDIIMPEMDGLEVLRYMQRDENLSHIGVLVATSTKEKTERTALSLGADDIVSKPYDPLVIRKRLENILAAKVVAEQKNLLLKDDIDGLIQKSLTEKSNQAEVIAERLRKCAEVISSNKDNTKLVAEIAADIKREADRLSGIFTTR